MAETSKLLFDSLNADDLREAENLLLHGADPNFVLPVEGVAPIHIAAGLGLEATKLLLQYGADPNIRSVEGITPLHVTATWGDKDCLQLLLQNGGDPFIQDQEGNNVLQSAKLYQHKECYRLLESYLLLLTPEDLTYQPEIIYQCRYSGNSFNETLESQNSTQPKDPRRKTIVSSQYLDDYLNKALKDPSRPDKYAEEIQRHIDQLINNTRKVSLDVTSPEHPYLEPKTDILDDSLDEDPSIHVHWADRTVPYSYSRFAKNHPVKPPVSVQDDVITGYSKTVTSVPSNLVKNSKSVSLQDLPTNHVWKNCEQLNKSLDSSTSDDTYLSCTSGPDVKTNIPLTDLPVKIYTCEKCFIPVKESVLPNSNNYTCENCYRLQAVSLHNDLDSYTKVRNFLLSSDPHYHATSRKIRCERNAVWRPPLRSNFDDQSLLTDDDSYFLQKEAEFEKEEHVLKKENKSFSTLKLDPAEFSELDSTILLDLNEIGDFTPKAELKTKVKEEMTFQKNSNSNRFVENERDVVNSKTSADPHVIRRITGDKYSIGSTYSTELCESSRQSLGFNYNNLRHSGSLDGKLSMGSFETNSPRYSGGSGDRDILNQSFYKRDSLDSNSTIEYVYKDPEKGITLIEKRLPSECGSRRSSIESQLSGLTAASANTDTTIIYDWKSYVKNKGISAEFETLDNDGIREKLKSFGDDPGPVTTTTRQTYLIRLQQLSQDPDSGVLKLSSSVPEYTAELRAALEGKFDDSNEADQMEAKMVAAFQNPNKNRRWREGTLKSSFNYLLLDPRVTRNLPNRIYNLGDIEAFKVFIGAIFYIGKGKGLRPYSHLYEAISVLNNNNKKISDKVQRIVDIWQEGLGVVSLHCFQSVIPVEAYTREACIMDAIGLHHLTNKKRGDYYGVSTTWTLKQKRKVGVHLLRKCYKIFLQDGERQLCPGDVK